MGSPLASGAGAVRDDLPSGLLIAVVIGMGQAMDSWLVTRQPDAEDLLLPHPRHLVGHPRPCLAPAPRHDRGQRAVDR